MMNTVKILFQVLILAGTTLVAPAWTEETPDRNRYLADAVKELERTVFVDMRLWPPQDELYLALYVMEKDALTVEEREIWQDEEAWLLAMYRLTFRARADKRPEPVIHWLRDWPAKGNRVVYVVWKLDDITLLGRRSASANRCLFAMYPADVFEGEAGVRLDRAFESSVNSLLCEYAALSLAPLEQPLQIKVFDGQHAVDKTLTTRVLSSQQVGDALFVSYMADYAGKLALSPTMWCSRGLLLMQVPDPVTTSDGRVPASLSAAARKPSP